MVVHLFENMLVFNHCKLDAKQYHLSGGKLNCLAVDKRLVNAVYIQ